MKRFITFFPVMVIAILLSSNVVFAYTYDWSFTSTLLNFRYGTSEGEVYFKANVYERDRYIQALLLDVVAGDTFYFNYTKMDGSTGSTQTYTVSDVDAIPYEVDLEGLDIWAIDIEGSPNIYLSKVIIKKDLTVYTYVLPTPTRPETGTEDPNVGGGSTDSETIICDGCELIKSMLACPEWDAYMAEWEAMIRRAVPPPPDWTVVAGTFRDAIVPSLITELDNLLGNAPSPPTVTDIQNKLPSSDPIVDTTLETVNQMTPQNPFEGILDFDLSTREEIAIVDESQPFIIGDPIENIDSTLPGEKVYPGGESNHTGGITIPISIVSEIPIPTQPTTDPLPGTTDPIPIPLPSGDGTGTGPNPSGTSGSFVEKYYYKVSP